VHYREYPLQVAIILSDRPAQAYQYYLQLLINIVLVNHIEPMGGTRIFKNNEILVMDTIKTLTMLKL